MKNVLLTSLFTIFFFFLLIFQINAQYIALYDEPEMKISHDAMNWENQKLRSDLTLTDNQFDQIKDITLERSKARSLVAKMFKYEPNKLEAKLLEIDSQFDTEFAEVLNAKQFKKYLTLQNRKASKSAETEQTVKQAEGANFNARIQQMIANATAPVIDPSLKPKQKITSQEIIAVTQDSLKRSPAEIQTGMKNNQEAAVVNDVLVPVDKSELHQQINASEKEVTDMKTEPAESAGSTTNTTESQNSELDVTTSPEKETEAPGE